MRLTGVVALIAVIGWAPVSVIAGAPQEAPASAASADLTGSWLVIERVGRYGRAPVHTDALEAEIVAGRWTAPRAGDVVRVSDELERTWQEAAPDEEGWLRHDALRGGYACWSVESDSERVMLLDASGHNLVYANGEPRAGDPYGTGWVLLPVRLAKGANTFLFNVSRGRVRAELVEPRSELLFNLRDTTLPDLFEGRFAPLEPVWAALPVINTTAQAQGSLVLETSRRAAAAPDAGVSSAADDSTVRTVLPVISPMSARKVGFRIASRPADDTGEVSVRLLRVEGEREEVLDTETLTLTVCDVSDKHKRTFVSEIDGSVQYYAVTPRKLETDGALEAPALFLTLHGAGVEALGQARAYDHKNWGHIVAPTNRRPYGFDWEDWGREDAMEVLAIAREQWRVDPERIYLTGHSMGGHGVWQVGATYPDLFAAIGPSAAWPDFWSYAGAADYENATPVEQMLTRAVSPSRTMELSRNYLHYGVYVLHGERDDNVPVSLARKMRAHLSTYHADFAYYERPGAGHWWGGACVDWPPMFDFFRHHTRPASETVRHVEFHTANPAVSASSHWVTIAAQLLPLDFSSVALDLDPESRRFSGTTKNVARLALDLGVLSAPRQREVNGEPVDATVLPAGAPLTVELDGQTLENVPWPVTEQRLWLQRDGEGWTVVSRPPVGDKGPHRYGPFKRAFRNRFMLVYPTHGTQEQNALAYAKARCDAETFGYRGNGSVDVVPDVDFDPATDRERNVILYGNADSNSAWVALLGDSPVQVRRGSVSVGDRVISGDGLACLFIRPRPGSDRALVGAVAGTGAAGMRLTERLPYFVSGLDYPDCIVLGPEVLTGGTAGIRVAGFFGLDWGVDSGNFAWSE